MAIRVRTVLPRRTAACHVLRGSDRRDIPIADAARVGELTAVATIAARRFRSAHAPAPSMH